MTAVCYAFVKNHMSHMEGDIRTAIALPCPQKTKMNQENLAPTLHDLLVIDLVATLFQQILDLDSLHLRQRLQLQQCIGSQRFPLQC